MRLLTLAGILAIAVAGFACGSDDGDGAATPTAGADRGTPVASRAAATSTPQAPEATATPVPTDTAEATATATSTPEALEYNFTTPEASGGSNTPRSAGPLGIVYADAVYGGAPNENRLMASAWVNAGINERPSASAWLANNFRALGDGGSVNAHVSTDVSWRGVLAGNGAAGTGASVTIRLELVGDDNRVVASEVVHTLEVRESALSIGGRDDVGNESVDMQAILVPGQLYVLRLTVTCEAYSGLLGVATHCIFGEGEVYDDGYVQWGPRTILFAP
jgi:hypothetical protein